jgi:parallel beta-helix repeat protein
VNGRPVYHLISQNGGTVPSGAGQVILLSCTGVTVEDQNLSRADVGLTIDLSTACYVQNITSCFGIVGVWIYDSSSNTIISSNLSGNIEAGLKLSLSDGNMVSENGFFDNLGYGVIASGTLDRMWNNTFARNNGAGLAYDPAHNQAYNYGTNFWNMSSWGNYWSDWTSPDIDYNGIVDQPYPIAGYNSAKDYYPRTTPTVFIPIEPIPELAPLTLAFLVIVLIGAISIRVRRTRQTD